MERLPTKLEYSDGWLHAATCPTEAQKHGKTQLLLAGHTVPANGDLFISTGIICAPPLPPFLAIRQFSGAGCGVYILAYGSDKQP